ncbi:hypothetical protein Hdeb2414_s0023g00628341 [Helianthus debilis subsp. tardiflorus]
MSINDANRVAFENEMKCRYIIVDSLKVKHRDEMLEFRKITEWNIYEDRMRRDPIIMNLRLYIMSPNTNDVNVCGECRLYGITDHHHEV